MKTKTKIIIIILLSLIAIGLITALFVIQWIVPNYQEENTTNIFAKNIIVPDRIVYRNKNGQYFQFAKDTEKYNQIKASIENAVMNYNESGNTLSEEEIDTVHEKSFIEFDYETASKNYLIPLEENDEANMIKLGNTGGIIVSSNLRNLENIITVAEEQSKNETAYALQYKEMISRNTINSMEYRYIRL